jgi:hypothetical protein
MNLESGGAVVDVARVVKEEESATDEPAGEEATPGVED